MYLRRLRSAVSKWKGPPTATADRTKSDAEAVNSAHFQCDSNFLKTATEVHGCQRRKRGPQYHPGPAQMVKTTPRMKQDLVGTPRPEVQQGQEKSLPLGKSVERCGSVAGRELQDRQPLG